MSKSKAKVSTEVKVEDTAEDTSADTKTGNITTAKSDTTEELSSTVIREGTAPKLRNTEQLIKYALVTHDD